MVQRRTKGEGGLVQRHDHASCPPVDESGERPAHKCRGRWAGTIDVVEGTTKRRKYVYGRTQKEARIKLAQAVRERDEGTLVVRSMTVEQWLDHWLDHIAARTIRPQTLRGYRSKIDLHLKPGIGKMRLTALQPEHIRALYDDMRKRNLAEASIRQTHAILKRSLKVAVQERKLATSPADRMESPSTETKEREQLTVEQARMVLTAAGDSARWWLAVFYGMRQGEVLGLRWCDVDFDADVIRVEQTLQKDENGVQFFGPPKSKSSRRPIPMLPQISARLRLHAANSEVDVTSTDLVFPGATGKPMDPKRDWLLWRKLLDEASPSGKDPLPRVALHAARNTAASLLEAAGVPDRLAAQILGHSNVRMTHRYQSAELARARDALTAVGQLLELE